MKSNQQPFWPNKARLAVSISMQFEAGGEPEYGADSPFSGTPLPSGYPDLPAKTWFQYGYLEGIPRLLNLWDKYGIKVTSHIVGNAALTNPDIAKEIVKRGHEAAAHGMSWLSQFNMTREQEKKFITEGAQAIKEVTGVMPKGYNCNWLRRSINTVTLLQELGFLYHIDDVSRDEPFVLTVNKKPFVVVPYTIRCNDIVLIEERHFTPDEFLEILKHEFDQLYQESEFRRRQMSISVHDRIGGTPAMVRMLDKFLEYANKHPGLWFARKDAIAEWVLENHLSQANPAS